MNVTTEQHPQSGRRVPQAVPFGRQVVSRGIGSGTILSVVVHLGLVALLVYATSPKFLDASRGIGDGDGRGGGGGGGGSAITALAIALGATPPAPPPVVVEQVPTLAVPTTVEPIPEPVPDSVPPTPAADTAAAQGVAQGPGVGPGQGPGIGPGSGGGSGGGTGGGVGPGVGPDSGGGAGGGGNIFPPQPLGIILPPPGRPGDLRGVRITVTFFISERGEVVRVSTDPEIRDRGYRNEFLNRMRRYTFTPAYTRDGRAVASEFPFQITL